MNFGTKFLKTFVAYYYGPDGEEVTAVQSYKRVYNLNNLETGVTVAQVPRDALPTLAKPRLAAIYWLERSLKLLREHQAEIEKTKQKLEDMQVQEQLYKAKAKSKMDILNRIDSKQKGALSIAPDVGQLSIPEK